jgi:hypothetical protein
MNNLKRRVGKMIGHDKSLNTIVRVEKLGELNKKTYDARHMRQMMTSVKKKLRI